MSQVNDVSVECDVLVPPIPPRLETVKVPPLMSAGPNLPSRAQIRPLWDGQAFAPRLVLPLALSWDHRVVDGAAAARFLQHLAALLADFRRITL